MKTKLIGLYASAFTVLLLSGCLHVKPEQLPTISESETTVIQKEPVISLSVTSSHDKILEDEIVTLSVDIGNQSTFDVHELEVKLIELDERGNWVAYEEKSLATLLASTEKTLQFVYQPPQIQAETEIDVKIKVNHREFGELASFPGHITVIKKVPVIRDYQAEDESLKPTENVQVPLSVEDKDYKEITTAPSKERCLTYMENYPQGKYLREVREILESLLWAEIKDKFNSRCEMTIFDEYLDIFTEDNGQFFDKVQNKVKIVTKFEQQQDYKGYKLFAKNYPQGKCGEIAKKRATVAYWKNRDQNNPQVLLQIAVIYKESSNHDKAIFFYKAAIKNAQGKKYPEAYAALEPLLKRQ